MSDAFTLAGSWTTTPQVGTPSGIAGFSAPIDEEAVLTQKHYDTIVLSVDSPVTINFGGSLTNAHVVILKATGGKVRVRVTSTDGSTQSVPIDFLALVCREVPITAIDLTRVAGTVTTVDVFLGQLSP